MNFKDILLTAMGNTFQSKARTTLTTLAIFVGAFTLILTSSVGTGVKQYVTESVDALGAKNIMIVSKPGAKSKKDNEPAEYDPNVVANDTGDGTTTLLAEADLGRLRNIDGVDDAEPMRTVKTDYVQRDDGKKFVIDVTGIPGATIDMAAGEAPDEDETDYEVAIPIDYVDRLDFDDNSDALGKKINLAITDAAATQHVVQAEIVGVMEKMAVGPSRTNIVPNEALLKELFELQQTGAPADKINRWTNAVIWFDSNSTQTEIDALKKRLEDDGFKGVTIADQLGTVTSMINAITLVLNGFALITLVAAGFGIVNTLLMSVQERTREIGLMKAMGMRGGRIFALFSLEATFIGFLGSILGVIVAMGAGNVINSLVASATTSGSFLENLPGLYLVGFNPVAILMTVVLIMALAFIAGTLPAMRAARKNPVDALRYE